ncbi:MAG: YcaO-like family protein [Bacteroidales bacterium]|jgi:ribosomal protein S12 methylthiotransferase accessory factor|nr:YcaO-like family protein [Bacteroidales bacterium]
MKINNEIFQIKRSLDLVSNRIGLLTHIGEVAHFNSDPKMYAYSAYNCETKMLGGEYYAGKSGGCGFTWEQAFLSAIGEGVERYCPTFYDKTNLKVASYNQLLAQGENAIAPDKFSLFHSEQYKKPDFVYKQFTGDLTLYWDKVIDMFSEEEIYCPASFIYMPFSIDINHISEQISTGYAAHSEIYKAFLNGVFEVIERDAFMITWMNLLDIPKISISGKLKKFVDKIVPSHMNLYLFDMTTDIRVPSIMGIMTGKHEYGNFIAFSAATRMTYTDAINKTILELCQSVPYYRYLLYENENKKMDDFNDIKSFEDHSIFYTKHPELYYLFDNWINKKPDKLVDYEDENILSDIDSIEYILNLFRNLNLSIYSKEITTEDVFEANFRVIRVICPELIPLNGTYGKYYLGGKRLYETPVNMGFKRASYETLNNMPHPFP